MTQVHQNQFLGYYTDEVKGVIYSIGAHEQVIKQWGINAHQIVPLNQTTVPTNY